MASKQTIVSEVGTIVQRAGGYSAWQIGITNDPVARKDEWGKTKHVGAWRQWTADSLADAQAIENYFINDKKMKGGVGGGTVGTRTVYVYIF